MNPEIPDPPHTPGEQVHKTELLAAESVGMQARLLLGDFTNTKLSVTKKELSPIAAYGALGIAAKAADIYDAASLTERRRYQQETGLTYTKWRDGMDGYLDGIRQDEEHTERKEFLETLGITDAVGADDFYNEFLGGKSDIIKFVDFVELQATPEQIENNEDIIRSLGNAFGYESSEVIDHLIHGVRNVKNDIDGFIEEATQQVNTAEVMGSPLLQKLREGGKIEEEDLRPIAEKTAPSSQKKAASPPSTQPTPSPSASTSTPIPTADLEEEHEVTLPSTKAPTAEKEEVGQVFPAPDSQQEHLDKPLSDNELDEALQYLLYNDVLLQQTDTQADILRTSERVKYYARELHGIMQDYGSDFVLERAVTAVLTLNKDLRQVHLKSDKPSRSQSWYLWGIAKSRFLANNPDIQATLPNAQYYDPFDPLLHYHVGAHSEEGKKSQKAEDDIISGMMGWEVYRQRKKLKEILSHLDPGMTLAEKSQLQLLLTEPPKDKLETLSTFQLREIGRLVRSNLPKK